MKLLLSYLLKLAYNLCLLIFTHKVRQLFASGNFLPSPPEWCTVWFYHFQRCLRIAQCKFSKILFF